MAKKHEIETAAVSAAPQPMAPPPDALGVARARLTEAENAVTGLQDRERILKAGLDQHRADLQALLERRAAGQNISNTEIDELKERIDSTSDELVGVRGLIDKAQPELERARAEAATAAEAAMAAQREQEVVRLTGQVIRAEQEFVQGFVNTCKALAELGVLLDHLALLDRQRANEHHLRVVDQNIGGQLINNDHWQLKSEGYLGRPWQRMIQPLIPPGGFER